METVLAQHASAALIVRHARLIKQQAGALGLGLLLCAAAAAPALASANVWCSIDDRILKVDFDGIAGRSGPIYQLQEGASITIKAPLKLTKPKIDLKMENLLQQWVWDGELRLQFEAEDEAAKETISLVITAKLNLDKEKFFGTYKLLVVKDDDRKEFKGKIKSCESG